MTTGQTTLAVAALVIGYSLFRKGAAAGRLVFYPEKIRSLDFDGTTPIMKFGLGIQNTSNQRFTINSIAGNAYVNNTYFGNVSNFTQVIVQPNSQAILPLIIRVSLIGAIQQIIEAIDTGNIRVNINIDLTINVDNLQMDQTFKFSIGG